MDNSMDNHNSTFLEPQTIGFTGGLQQPPEVKKARLGSITESAAANPSQVDSEAPRSLTDSGVERYKLLDLAGQIHGKNHRVSSCQKVPSYGVQQGAMDRGISKNENGRAHFHGVGSCGDVWVCPHCAPRIAEGRRKELLKAMGEARRRGWKALLVTRTFKHGREDGLKETIKRMQKATSQMKSCRAYKKMIAEFNLQGHIRALEVTHSWANGWHPHHHEILFVDNENLSDKDIKEFEKNSYEIWKKYAEKNGLGTPSREHGLRVDYRKGTGDSDAVGYYVSKFGFEMTYSHSKQGKQGSRTPWNILLDIYGNQNGEKYLKWSPDVELLKEFGKAMKGRAQLFWSRGLKELLNVNDESDEEIADKPMKHHVRSLSDKEWNAILWADSRGKVLDVATNEPMFLDGFIDSLVSKMENHYRKLQANERERERWIRESTNQAIDDVFCPG
jgi:hypothetical protein